MTRTDIKPTDVSKLSQKEREDIVVFHLHRWRANMLCFSQLCFKAVCRRARTCSAHPEICMAQLVPIVPYEALEGVDALLMGKLDGLTFDEVCARAPQAVGACEEWLARVNEGRLNRARARLQPKPGS